ncbi:hypothetical protein Dimus_026955 [Dionaea muscipula]
MDMLGILNMASRTSNSRSGSSSNVVGHVSNCRNCGIRRKMYTSRTDDNPGRRFMQCPRRDCNHFTWIDDPLSEPASEIIRGLLRRINMLEAQLAASNTHQSEETEQMVADTILAAPVNVGEPIRDPFYSINVMIEKVRLDRKDGIAKVAGTISCVAGATVITLYKGPTIYDSSITNIAPYKTSSTTTFVSNFSSWSSWGCQYYYYYGEELDFGLHISNWTLLIVVRMAGFAKACSPLHR